MKYADNDDAAATDGSAASGVGVQQSEDYDVGETGFKCLAKMPTTGGFFTRESKHGQP